jgi:glycosyltransferase involved in cell wall biosynthesis
MLFYAEFNIRLFLFLLFHRADLLLSNDLDSLPANFLASRLKRIPLVYDSHEYFTEVPELIGRPRVRRFWEWLERKLVPGVNAAYTVSESIASIYSAKYHVPFDVVRNLPLRFFPAESVTAPANREHRKVIMYQGALNKGRGLIPVIQAMEVLPDMDLWLAGGGDEEQNLRALVAAAKLNNVKFLGRLPLEELKYITCRADAGISVEEDMGLSYRYALPNKLFDYIQARIPVVVSNLPEMARIVRAYGIGLVAESHDPAELASDLRKALTDGALRAEWKINLEKAANELNWDHEEKTVEKIFRKYL